MKADFEYVDEADGLDRVVDRLRGKPTVSLDTEGNSLYNYFERVCLIQLSIGEHHVLIDPLSGLDLSGFYDALADCPLILHAADNDLRALYSEAGFIPRAPLFDTLIAAQLLGEDQLSLAALVQTCCGIELSKSGQKSNWGRRPLSEKQIAYAVDDTRYLAAIARKLRKRLEKLNRLEWHEEWCARSVEVCAQTNHKDDGEAWRIRGSGKLNRRELSFLREIWRWRDKEARAADRPPFKILGNDQLLELARWSAHSPGRSLRSGPRLPKNISSARVQGLDRALNRARRLPKARWPEKVRSRSNGYPGPDFREDSEWLKRRCREVAEELSLDRATIAPRAALEAIARTRPDTDDGIRECSGLMAWQVELIRDHVYALYAQED